MAEIPEHLHEIRVYYEDTDAGGIAYHANYLGWAERGRTEALRAMNLPHAEMASQHGAFLVVKRVEVEYFQPARLDDLVTVRTRIRRVSAILDLDQDVMLEGAVLAALKVRLVCVGVDTLRPRAIPEPWRSALRAVIAEPESEP
jgi:acyl-CoA thioester hydrolase